MRRRWWRYAVLTSGWAIFALAIAVPTVALLVRSVAERQPPRGGWTISPRQWGLLGKSAGLTAAGTLLTLALAVPGAYVVGQLGRLSRRPVLSALLLAPLLFPPMVYVFGWQKLLPLGFPQQVACVGVWALWAYPIPALLVGSGWARLGRGSYEAALLETTTGRAFGRVVLPLLAPHLAVSALVLLVLFLGEYSVPHACGMLVYATELLAWSSESRYAIDALWPTLPLGGLILVLVLAARRVWRRGVAEEIPVQDTGVRRTSRPFLLLAAACFLVSTVLPIAVLASHLRSLGVMRTALETYGLELATSLAVVGGSGLAVAGMGVCVAAWRPLRRVGLIWALAFGALPGALVGSAVLVAYRSFPVIYDHWPIVVLGFVARFGWIGLLAMWLASRSVPEELTWQAQADGADEISATLRIHAALSWPTLLFGACLVAAFSLAELPTSQLVQPPTVSLIAHILMEKFHRFEDGMLISLSLWLVMCAIPPALLLAVILRRQRLVR